jgi:hypothetical protein
MTLLINFFYEIEKQQEEAMNAMLGYSSPDEND